MPTSNPLDPAEIAVTLDLAGGIADHLEQLAPVFAREAGSGAAADMLRLASSSLRTSAALLRGAVSLGDLGAVTSPGAAYERPYFGMPSQRVGGPELQATGPAHFWAGAFKQGGGRLPPDFTPAPDAAELAALTGASSWTPPPDFTPAPDATELAALTEGSEVKRPGSRKRVPKPKAVNKEVSP